jgi:uridine phosphorylase
MGWVTLRRAGREAQTVQLSKNTFVRILTRRSAIEDIKVGDQIIACGSVENGAFVAEIVNLSK